MLSKSANKPMSINGNVRINKAGFLVREPGPQASLPIPRNIYGKIPKLVVRRVRLPVHAPLSKPARIWAPKPAPKPVPQDNLPVPWNLSGKILKRAVRRVRISAPTPTAAPSPSPSPTPVPAEAPAPPPIPYSEPVFKAEVEYEGDKENILPVDQILSKVKLVSFGLVYGRSDCLVSEGSSSRRLERLRQKKLREKRLQEERLGEERLARERLMAERMREQRFLRLSELAATRRSKSLTVPYPGRRVFGHPRFTDAVI